jgi:hypothetical protein
MKGAFKKLVILTAIGIVTALSLIVFRSPQKVEAQSSCSNSTLDTSYRGYSFGLQSGTRVNGVDIYTFDGSGGYSGSYWSMSGGSAGSGTFSGDYSISSDCSGYLYDPSTGTTRDRIVISSSGSEVDMVNEASGANISIVIKKE